MQIYDKFQTRKKYFIKNNFFCKKNLYYKDNLRTLHMEHFLCFFNTRNTTITLYIYEKLEIFACFCRSRCGI